MKRLETRKNRREKDTKTYPWERRTLSVPMNIMRIAGKGAVSKRSRRPPGFRSRERSKGVFRPPRLLIGVIPGSAGTPPPPLATGVSPQRGEKETYHEKGDPGPLGISLIVICLFFSFNI